jgi:hypothetical protein
LQKTEAAIPIADLEYHIQGWLLDGECRELSDRTLDSRRRLTGKLLWFLRDREYPTCGTQELRAFLACVRRGRQDPGAGGATSAW